MADHMYVLAAGADPELRPGFTQIAETWLDLASRIEREHFVWLA
jgi:hypothetical protein